MYGIFTYIHLPYKLAIHESVNIPFVPWMVMGKEFPSLDYPMWSRTPCRSHQDEFGELFLLCSLAERPKQTSQAAVWLHFIAWWVGSLHWRFEARRIQREIDGRMGWTYHGVWVDQSDLSPLFGKVSVCAYLFLCVETESYLNLCLSSSGVVREQCRIVHAFWSRNVKSEWIILCCPS